MLYRPGRNTTRQPSGSAQAHEDQFISSVAPLPFPLEARLNESGEAVTLLQTCEWKGHSPATIGVDARGQQFLASFEEVTVTDHRAVPNPAIEAIRSGRQT